MTSITSGEKLDLPTACLWEIWKIYSTNILSFWLPALSTLCLWSLRGDGDLDSFAKKDRDVVITGQMLPLRSAQEQRKLNYFISFFITLESILFKSKHFFEKKKLKKNKK